MFPENPGSAIRMIQYFINRAGKRLPSSRRRELERARQVLQRPAETRRSGGLRRQALDRAANDSARDV
jgi:hypothetical protein